MSALYRKEVSKDDSRREFNREAKRTNAKNISPNPMRGGIRL